MLQSSENMVGLVFLDHLLSSSMFFVFCLGFYAFSVCIGSAPLRPTLLSEMFSPTEQVRKFLKSESFSEILACEWQFLGDVVRKGRVCLSSVCLYFQSFFQDVELVDILDSDSGSGTLLIHLGVLSLAE